MLKKSFHPAAIIVLAAVVALGLTVEAQEVDDPHAGHHPANAEAPGESQAVGAPDMMARHEAMMSRMQEAGARLNQLTTEMNNAEGAEKVDRMAALVSELVRHMTDMSRGMAEMHGEMMGHMGGGMMGQMHGAGAEQN